jgi:hypothetical protein
MMLDIERVLGSLLRSLYSPIVPVPICDVAGRSGAFAGSSHVPLVRVTTKRKKKL